MSKIEWTEKTWNPVVGCSPVSEGCRNCYAARSALRLAGNPNPKIGPLYEGTSEMRGTGEARRPVFTGKVKTVERRLEDPLHWKKPRRVFVNSMSDLFHEDVPFDFVDKVFAVMAKCPQHTFQVLTKRPERMAEYLNGIDMVWPLPNVWVGTSVENQAAADERIPHLLRCPAAVRFLSCEPLLGPVDLWSMLAPGGSHPNASRQAIHLLDWVIAGGESGPGARPCGVEWIRSLARQCRATGVAVFTKQLGSVPAQDLGLSDRKGGDPSEWPEDLRVREFPQTQPEEAS